MILCKSERSIIFIAWVVIPQMATSTPFLRRPSTSSRRVCAQEISILDTPLMENSTVFLVSRLSFIEINYENVDMNRMHVTDPVLCERYSNAKVVYITGPMIFANTMVASMVAINSSIAPLNLWEKI